MSTKFKYPREYELKELFNSFTDRDFINKFAQQKGVFITNGNQEEISKELSTLLYDEADLEVLRKEAYQISANHTLNGFTVVTKEKNFDLAKTYNSIITNGTYNKEMVLSPLTSVTENGSEFKSIHKGTIQYRRRKPGRIEFLQYEENSFDFYFKEIGKKKGEIKWQVEVDCNRSTDSKELKKLIYKHINKEVDIETIDQDDINVIHAIEFFDELAKSGLDAIWQCRDVKHITVGKGKNDNDPVNNTVTDIEEEEEEDKEIEEEEVIEIKQAILQGQNLRQNKFVREFESSGYKFTAMTYEFHHTKDPYIIQIKAEFKGRPKVFEVSIKNYEEISGTSATRKPSYLSETANRNIRSQFWNNAKSIYEKL